MGWGRIIKLFALYGGSLIPEKEQEQDKPYKSQPSEVAHLSKKERKKRQRIRHLSRRRR